jgi:hypothetical protein
MRVALLVAQVVVQLEVVVEARQVVVAAVRLEVEGADRKVSDRVQVRRDQ